MRTTPADEEDQGAREAASYCALFLATTAGVLLFVALTNILVDPTDDFGVDLLPPIVVTSRSTKVSLAKEYRADVANLVVGSSRSMKLRPATVTELLGDASFNAAVNSARVEDWLSWLRFTSDELGWPIRHVIVGVDVEAFHTVPPDARLLSNRVLLRHIADLSWIEMSPLPLAEAVSWHTFDASLKSLHRQMQSAETSVATRFEPDGFLVYEKWEQELLDGRFAFSPRLKLSKKEYAKRFKSFGRLSPERLAAFDTFLDECQRRGVKLHLFVTSLHPELLRHLSATTEFDARRDDVVSILAAKAASRGFGFIDATELEAYGGDATQFFDGGHVMEPNAARILKASVAASWD